MLTLNSAMVSEIRRYSQPRRVMHAVLQATLLLLGEPEYLTDVTNARLTSHNIKDNSCVVVTDMAQM